MQSKEIKFFPAKNNCLWGYILGFLCVLLPGSGEWDKLMASPTVKN